MGRIYSEDQQRSYNRSANAGTGGNIAIPHHHITLARLARPALTQLLKIKALHLDSRLYMVIFIPFSPIYKLQSNIWWLWMNNYHLSTYKCTCSIDKKSHITAQQPYHHIEKLCKDRVNLVIASRTPIPLPYGHRVDKWYFLHPLVLLSSIL